MTNWQVKKLGDIATIKRGGSPRPIQDYLISNDHEGYSWLKIGDVPVGSRYIYKTSAKIKPEGLKKTTFVKSGELILSNSMSFGRPYIMKTDACIHDGWLALQDIDKSVNKNFLYYLLISDRMQNKFKNYSAGSGVLNLKKETVQAIEFKSPEKPEQERIVKVLEVWDEYIEKLEQKIALKEQLKKGLMQQLLTGRKRLPGFNKEWQLTTIGRLGQIISGGTPDTTKNEYWGGEINWITPSEITKITRKINEKTEKTITDTGLKASSATLIPKNSIILCSRATIGACAVNLIPVATNQGFKNIVPNNNVNVWYLYYWFKTNKKALIRISSGSTFLEFSKRDAEKLSIQIPNKDEQRQIVNMLCAMDDEIEMMKMKNSKLHSQKKYLLKNLITGTIRTPENLKPKGEAV